MKLTVPDYIILIVDDLDRALRFYTDVLGLRLGHRSGAYAQLETGTTRLGFYTREAMANTLGLSLQAPAQNTPGFEIGFKVPDSPVTPPTNRPWGQRTAYVRDPDGHLIELAQDLDRPEGKVAKLT